MSASPALSKNVPAPRTLNATEVAAPRPAGAAVALRGPAMTQEALWGLAKSIEDGGEGWNTREVPAAVREAFERIAGDRSPDPVNPRAQLTYFMGTFKKVEGEAGQPPLYVTPIFGGAPRRILIGAAAIDEAGTVIQQCANRHRTMGLLGPGFELLVSGGADSFEDTHQE